MTVIAAVQRQIGFQICVQLGEQGCLQLLFAHDLVASLGLGIEFAGKVQIRLGVEGDGLVMSQIQLGHQIRIPDGGLGGRGRLGIEAGQVHLAIVAEYQVGRRGRLFHRHVAIRGVEIRARSYRLVVGDADRHQLVKFAALLIHHHGGGFGQALLLLFQLGPAPAATGSPAPAPAAPATE